MGRCLAPKLPLAAPLLVPLFTTLGSMLTVLLMCEMIANTSFFTTLQRHHRERALVFALMFSFQPMTKVRSPTVGTSAVYRGFSFPHLAVLGSADSL